MARNNKLIQNATNYWFPFAECNRRLRGETILNTWHFSYKAHIDVDKDTGLVHYVGVTGANARGVAVTSNLLTGEETEVYGDSGYLGADKREDAITRNKQGKAIHTR